MKKENIAEYLLNLNPQPEELNNEVTRLELAAFIAARVTRTEYKHKDIIHSAGTVCERIFFIESGLLRGYKYDKNLNKDKTKYFWDTHTLVTDANSLMRQKPSDIFIQVLSDTTVQSITYTHLQEIFTAFPFTKSFLVSLLDHDEKYSNKKYFGEGIDAYNRLLAVRKSFLRIELIATKEMIASYLCITRQHLSKIIRENDNYKRK